MQNEARLSARLPGRLASAVSDRAHALGMREADVIRAALVREVVAPPDPKSRAFVELWLSGAAETASEEK